jgi:hypothetical protein
VSVLRYCTCFYSIPNTSRSQGCCKLIFSATVMRARNDQEPADPVDTTSPNIDSSHRSQPDRGSFQEFVAKRTLGDGGLWDITFSKDPQKKFLYLADGANEKV